MKFYETWRQAKRKSLESPFISVVLQKIEFDFSMIEQPEYLLDSGLIIALILVLLEVSDKSERIDSQILKNGLEVGVEEVKTVLTKDQKKAIRKQKRLQRRLEAGILEDIEMDISLEKKKSMALNRGKSTMIRS